MLSRLAPTVQSTRRGISRAMRPLSSGVFAPLTEMRSAAGPRMTNGLTDEWLEKFSHDPRLMQAINDAHGVWKDLDPKTTYALHEEEFITRLSPGLQLLYAPENRQPFVPIGARGPWMVSAHGAVVHDNGGYGMLGHGHNPQRLSDAMSAPAVMANHMTPSLQHKELVDALKAEIGRSRSESPYESFILLNSGSEANELVLRICDMHCGHVVGERKPHIMTLQGCFHGRTLAAAMITDTCREAYHKEKANLIVKVQDAEGWNYVLATPVNDVDAMRYWFERADAEGCHLHTMYIEGVMGEGNPGVAITPEFYMAARQLTLERDAALCVDSVQAGMRATGNLSICDYPGFETLPPPDFEVYSKAANGGQYPVSIIALSPRAKTWYQHGVYGNTMTGNPRSCRVVAESLRMMTPELRQNIQDMGRYFVSEYTKLMNNELAGVIIKVDGTGLLYQVKLDPKIEVCKKDTGVEVMLRKRGINVIHGGTNALRFTPNFAITREEADMQISHVRDVLLERKAAM